MGSIIDRAATLSVRHFFLFTGTICVFVSIPFAAALYAIFAGDGTQLVAILHAVERGASTVPDLTPSAASLGQIVAADVALAVGAVLGSIGGNAVAVNVAEILAGQPPSFARSIGRALARAPQTLGVLLLGGLIGIGAVLVLGAIVGVVVVAIAGAYHAGMHSALALSALITVAVFLFAAMLAILLLLSATITFAEFATVLEQRRIVDALGVSFARVFARSEWKRVLLLVVVLVVVSMLVGFAGELVGFAFLMVGSLAGAGVVYVLAEVAATAVTAVFYAVYYCDVLRREAAPAAESLGS